MTFVVDTAFGYSSKRFMKVNCAIEFDYLGSIQVFMKVTWVSAAQTAACASLLA
jgi:hypothetical protein